MNPISRLEMVQAEAVRAFGTDYVDRHPEIIIAALASATIDYAAGIIAGSLQAIAVALADDNVPSVGVARVGELLRPR